MTKQSIYGVGYYKDGKFEGRVGGEMTTWEGAIGLAKDWHNHHAGLHMYRAVELDETGSVIRAQAVPAQPLKGRSLEIFDEVHAKSHIWEAYDQGRMSHAQGEPRERNPFSSGHSYAWDWTRGWDFESGREGTASLESWKAGFPKKGG